MSSDNSSNPPSPPSLHNGRRSSFSPGQTISTLFGRAASASSTNNMATPPFPGSIATAAANAQTRRRMSINTMGLAGVSPTQTSPFGYSPMSGSFSSGQSDESVIEEGDAPTIDPTTPFARRMSFGARALRDSRTGGSPGATGSLTSAGRASSSPFSPSKIFQPGSVPSPTPLSSSPTVRQPAGITRRSNRAASHSEGFSWSESLRSHAERTSSISQANARPNPHHHRAFSAAAADIPPPVREMPKQPVTARRESQPRVPDPFQERILKGDFYMD